jgi:hypothetical protein
MYFDSRRWGAQNMAWRGVGDTLKRLGGEWKMSEPETKARALPPYLVPTIWIPVISALLVAYLSYQLGLNAQLKLTGKQKRQQAYSELMGRKTLLSQLWTSSLVADTYFYYHEAKWWLAGGPTEASLHLEEARRWQHKGEDLSIEIAKTYQSLFETLGEIRSYFPYSDRLRDLTTQIYHSKWFHVQRLEVNWTAEQLEQWREQTIKNIQELTKEFDKMFDDLVPYLEAVIDKEAG